MKLIYKSFNKRIVIINSYFVLFCINFLLSQMLLLNFVEFYHKKLTKNDSNFS